MKKFFAIALLSLSIGTGAFANTTEAVSKTVTNHFKADFTNATNVSWTSGDSYTKASFTMDGKKMEAFYNTQGEVIGTSSNVGLDELPVNAKRTLAKKFTGYTVTEAIHFDGVEENAYYISLENDKEAVILKVGDNNQVVNFKRTKK